MFEKYKKEVLLVGLLIAILGMFFSRAMLSIGLIITGICFFIGSDKGLIFRSFIKNPFGIAFFFFVLSYLISGIYTDDLKLFVDKTLMKLPLLFVPLGIFSVKQFPKKYFQFILLFFTSITALFSCISFIGYLQNYKEITASYEHAKTIPLFLDINHIRFSLLLALSSLLIYFGYKYDYFKESKLFKIIFLFFGVVNFLFLHLLSVRSGLLGFYAATFVIIVFEIIFRKKILLGAAALIMLITLPIVSYFYVPTFKKKIKYMKRDVAVFFKGENANIYSDSNRLISMQLALDIIKKNPVLGIGIGDVKNEMVRSYENKFPQIEKQHYLEPHNQILYTYLGCGLLGLISIVSILFIPIFSAFKNQNDLGLAYSIIMATSFFTEHTLEVQLGVAVYIIFIGLFFFIPKTVIDEK